jgi:hypothetical protein
MIGRQPFLDLPALRSSVFAAAAQAQLDTPLVCRCKVPACANGAHSRDPFPCRSFAATGKGFLFRNVSGLTFATRRNMLAGR